MSLLKDKVAVITGASKGIGLGISEAFLREGASVYAIGRNFTQEQATLQQLAKDRGTFYQPIVLDLHDKAQISSVLGQEIDKPLDVVINNAGIVRDKLFFALSPEDWEAVIEVNLTGAFLVLKALLPQMKRTGGAIINISSVVGQSGNLGQANYAASKAGLIGLTKTLALELGRRQIRVNAVAPGLVDTEMMASIPVAQKEAFLKRIPLGRAGQPQDIANACVFLASEMGAYVTGTVLEVNGGLRT